MKRPFVPSRALRTECEAALRGTEWMAGIHEPLQSRLFEIGRWIEAEAGELLGMAGDETGGIFGIGQGAVYSRPAPTAPDIAMTDVHMAPFWIVSRTILPGEERMMTLVAQTRVTALQIPQISFLQMMDTHPELRLHLLRNISNIFARVTLALSDALIRSADARCIAVLLRVADRRFDGLAPVDIPIGQMDLAGMANLSRQKTGDVLRELEGRGLVKLGYRRISILRPELLRAMLED